MLVAQEPPAVGEARLEQGTGAAVVTRVGQAQPGRAFARLRALLRAVGRV